MSDIVVKGASEHNLKNIDVTIKRGSITVITGASGSGKSSLAFDTILRESQRRFFHTLSQYSRQFLDLSSRPKVKSMTGLSPAIALAQTETTPSRKATVGTLSDIGEMLGVMYANFGEKLCPTHHLATSEQTIPEICQTIRGSAKGKTIALCVSLAHNKKGTFRAALTKFRDKHFSKAYIDGKIYNLEKIPDLEREEKHTIKVIIDQIKVKEDTSPLDRLARSVELCLKEGEGFGEYYMVSQKVDQKTNSDAAGLEIKSQTIFSTSGGCPTCGFSWPKLDTRYFSANSLGKCDVCDGYASVIEEIKSVDDENNSEEDQEFFDVEPCVACDGTGIRADVKSILLGGHQLHGLLLMPLNEFFRTVETLKSENQAFLRVKDEILNKENAFSQLGLEYLNLARRVRSLSGGELQRLKLAGVLSSQLRGVMYILDEPSQGLHPKEIVKLWESLENLRSAGNTLIIVDHDEELMRRADEIIDLGPSGGAEGGQLIAQFEPKRAKSFAAISSTARALTETHKIETYESNLSEFIHVKKPRLHNLKMPAAKFVKHGITLVSGVSGAGKTTLAIRTLYDGVQDYFTQGGKHVTYKHCESISGIESFERVMLIDRRPIAKSSVRIPATYLDLMGDLRDLYASLPEAGLMGLTARSFSIASEGGRCPDCKGRGEVNLQMRFLADARVICATCQGTRFRPHILDVKFNNLNLNDVLNLTLDQAYEHFKYNKRVSRKLEPAIQLGLGYLKMGQPSASLSGGESQRLKLVPFFQKRLTKGELIVVDEPTVGLHFSDIAKLCVILQKLRDAGVTIVIIDNSAELLKITDYFICLGPGAASQGGQLIYEGKPDPKYLQAN